MQGYIPNKYETEALTWAVRRAPALAEKVRASEDYFNELRAEFGPNLDEFAITALAKASSFVKADYVSIVDAWAKGYSLADNS
jgi:hypothetical protein